MKDTPPGHLHMMANDDLFTAKDVKFFQDGDCRCCCGIKAKKSSYNNNKNIFCVSLLTTKGHLCDADSRRPEEEEELIGV